MFVIVHETNTKQVIHDWSSYHINRSVREINSIIYPSLDHYLLTILGDLIIMQIFNLYCLLLCGTVIFAVHQIDASERLDETESTISSEITAKGMLRNAD